jgi:hypothetical protein
MIYACVQTVTKLQQLPHCFGCPCYLAYRTVGSTLVVSVAWQWVFQFGLADNMSQYEYISLLDKQKGIKQIDFVPKPLKTELLLCDI